MTTTMQSSTDLREYADYDKPLWRRPFLTREVAVIALLAIVVGFAAAQIQGFSQPITLSYLLLDVMPILLIALPMTMVIITGEIALSLASIIGLASSLKRDLTQAGLPITAAARINLLTDEVGEALYGYHVHVVRLTSLALTIGSLALFRGLAVGLLGTTAVTDFPKFWTDLAKARIGETPIPVVTLLFLALLIVFAILLHFTPFGRGVYSIGLSKSAAHFSGVNVERTKFILFALCGAVSALAGIYYTLRYGSARGDNA